ncbi:homoserine dehydrogenase [Spirochaeta dissipatitropha]
MTYIFVRVSATHVNSIDRDQKLTYDGAMKSIQVTIVGAGTVGANTAKILLSEAESIARRIGTEVKLRAIASLAFDVADSLELPKELYTTDTQAALTDPETDIIVELIGGIHPAKEFITTALKAGKHVVTANKALLAYHGHELMAIARENNVALAFEASCAGGVPIVQVMTQAMLGEQMDAIYGILNGTCNYILSQMGTSSYDKALKQAQKLGLAEADPTLDVSGEDTAHKIAILSTIAFGTRVPMESITTIGIDKLDPNDIRYAKRLGYVVKLLAMAQQTDEGPHVMVSPAFIPKEHPLARVDNAFNAISLYSNNLGHTLYYGRGAGGRPTGSAVVSDIIGLAAGTYQTAFADFRIWSDQAAPLAQTPAALMEFRYYLRLELNDVAGALAAITAVFAKHGISIASMLQDERWEHDQSVPVIITVHPTPASAIHDAISEIEALPVVNQKATVYSMVDEHPETPGLG